MDERQRRRRRRELLEKSRYGKTMAQKRLHGKQENGKNDFFLFQFCMTMVIVVVVVAVSFGGGEKTKEMIARLETAITSEIPMSSLTEAGEKVVSVFQRKGSELTKLFETREKKEPKTDSANQEVVVEYEADIPEESLGP